MRDGRPGSAVLLCPAGTEGGYSSTRRRSGGVEKERTHVRWTRPTLLDIAQPNDRHQQIAAAVGLGWLLVRVVVVLQDR